MNSLTLTREQISKLISIYEHFKEIHSFTVQLEDDNKISVTFDLADINPAIDKSFIPRILHR